MPLLCILSLPHTGLLDTSCISRKFSHRISLIKGTWSLLHLYQANAHPSVLCEQPLLFGCNSALFVGITSSSLRAWLVLSVKNTSIFSRYMNIYVKITMKTIRQHLASVIHEFQLSRLLLPKLNDGASNFRMLVIFMASLYPSTVYSCLG